VRLNPSEIRPTIVPNPAKGTPWKIHINDEISVTINESMLEKRPRKLTKSSNEYEFARMPLNAYLKVALLLALEIP
jgi:hypothetical protein